MTTNDVDYTESRSIADKAQRDFDAMTPADKAATVARWEAMSEFEKDELRASIALDLL